MSESLGYLLDTTNINGQSNKDFYSESESPFEIGETRTDTCTGCQNYANCACADVRIKRNFRNMVVYRRVKAESDIPTD